MPSNWTAYIFVNRLLPLYWLINWDDQAFDDGTHESHNNVSSTLPDLLVPLAPPHKPSEFANPDQGPSISAFLEGIETLGASRLQTGHLRLNLISRSAETDLHGIVYFIIHKRKVFTLAGTFSFQIFTQIGCGLIQPTLRSLPSLHPNWHSRSPW
jgi:hypothetical protein